MSALTEFPVVEIEDVAPLFVRHMILGAMAVQYVRSVPGLELDDGYAAARATWDTEWDDDPAPRSFESAREAVISDLQYWEEV